MFYTKDKQEKQIQKTRRHFTDEFKKQIIDLHYAGIKRSEHIKEYELTPSAFVKWIKKAKMTDSFKFIDNFTDDNVWSRTRQKSHSMYSLRSDQGKVIHSDFDKEFDNQLIDEYCKYLALLASLVQLELAVLVTMC